MQEHTHKKMKPEPKIL